MSIVIRRPWTRQPQTVVGIDFASPFARGLVDGFTTAGGVPTRLIGRGAITRANMSPLPLATQAGIGLAQKGSGTASYLQVPNLAVNGLSVIQITWVGQITSQNGEMIMELSATADSNNGSFYFYGLSATTFRIQTRTTSTQYTDPYYTCTPSPAVFSLRLNVSQSPHLHQLWVNGEKKHDSSVVNTAGTFGDYTLNVGSRNAASLYSDGAFGDMFVHDRWMTESELIAFHWALFSVYKPQSSRIWVPSAAAGVPTLTSIVASSVTSSGAVLTIN